MFYRHFVKLSEKWGVEEYYPLLKELNLQSVISGRVTVKLGLAESGKFITNDNIPVCKEIVSKKMDSTNGYIEYEQTRQRRNLLSFFVAVGGTGTYRNSVKDISQKVCFLEYAK